MACVEDLLGPPNYSFQKAQDELTGNLPFYENEDCTLSPAALLDDIMMDFDENLDLFFEQPLTFPNPKDLACLGIGDIMQPGLLQFEPNSSSPTETVGSPLGSATGHPKLGKRGVPENRVSQDLLLHFGQRGSPSVGQGLSNINKNVLQTNVSSRDIPMKGLSEGRNKSEPFKQKSFTRPVNNRLSDMSATGAPVSSNTLSFQPMPGIPQNSVKECLKDTSVPPHVQVDGASSRTSTAKHSIGQSLGCINRRSHTVKHFPTPALHRHRGSVPNAAHPSDKTLKQLFRNGFMDSISLDQDRVEGNSSSPALLNALLHGPEVQKKTSITPTFEGTSTRADDAQNSCSVPLLCSALTAPLSSQPRRQLALVAPSRPNNFLPPPQSTESQRPVLLGPASCLIADSLRPPEEIRNMSVDAVNFKPESGDHTTFPTAMLSTGQDTYPTSILKSTLTVPQPTMTNTSYVPMTPHIQSANTNGSNTEATFFKALTYGSETAPTNSTRYGVISDRTVSRPPAELQGTSALHPVFKTNTVKIVDPRSVRHQSGMDGVDFVSGAQPTQPLSMNPSNLDDRLRTGSIQTQYSLYSVVPSACDTARHRSSPADQNIDPSTAVILPTTQSSWSDAPASSRPPTLDSQFWPQNALKGQQPESFFPAVNAPESTMVLGKEESKGVNFQVNSTQPNPSLSSRGRSSSAGNLFPLPQPLHNYVGKPSSSTTMSSYGSTEVLSPPVSSQSNFLCTSSPSCSPPPPALIDPELSSRSTTTGNSSEEIRRQSMHAALQTLRRLVHMHSNLDGPAGGSRLAARRLMDLHDYRSSTISNRALEDMDDEIAPNWTRPKGAGTIDGSGTDPYNVGMSESGGTYKTTKAATLLGAAELIRGMREQRNALDAQQNSLRSERETLKKAIR
ncbi:unnamed protein product [Echinostoma caproni]|uniref:BHLH domain-containing protein n=1 Tax=Echinostoma caproni TaxID=27848 RepID=A0A183BA11_9TREM|nr:unnamed protein product [Echinostoma caproni]